jgi:hypothetical protein
VLKQLQTMRPKPARSIKQLLHLTMFIFAVHMCWNSAQAQHSVSSLSTENAHSSADLCTINFKTASEKILLLLTEGIETRFVGRTWQHGKLVCENTLAAKFSPWHGSVTLRQAGQPDESLLFIDTPSRICQLLVCQKHLAAQQPQGFEIKATLDEAERMKHFNKHFGEVEGKMLVKFDKAKLQFLLPKEQTLFETGPLP